MSAAAIDELGLNQEETELVERVFGAGRIHPWSDELVDDLMDWMGRATLAYLKAKRDSKSLDPFISQFSAFLDRVILERCEMLESAVIDVHEDPPYHTADRWPHTEFAVVRKVLEWVFKGSSP